MTDLLVLAVILALPVAMLVIILRGGLKQEGGAGFASLTAFHDFLPKDKQAAIEIVIEHKAGKSFQEQLNGDPPEKGKLHEHQ